MGEGPAVLIVLYGVFALIIGSMAARKNRNGWAWGLIGGLSVIVGLLVLMFMPFLCPKCGRALTNAEWNEKKCPTCGVV